MRPIKFRAWDKREKKWTIAEMGNTSVSPEEAAKNHFPTTSPVVFNGQGYCEIQQFTGLLDKNGKEVYEGDIVKVQFEDDMPYASEESTEKVFSDDAKTVLVEWNEGTGYFLPDELGYGEYCPAMNDDNFIIEVIGNIYENPELLK